MEREGGMQNSPGDVHNVHTFTIGPIKIICDSVWRCGGGVREAVVLAITPNSTNSLAVKIPEGERVNVVNVFRKV